MVIPRLADTQAYTKYSHYTYSRIHDKITLYIHMQQTLAQCISMRDREGVGREGEKTFCSHTKGSPEVERGEGGGGKGTLGGVAQEDALEKVVVHDSSYLLSLGNAAGRA
jgi:hypothetical protein